MKLHSKISGQGFPIIILHGYFGMGDNWKSHANTLAQNFEVHVIDQRNHGRSPHSDTFDYELMSEDLLEYFQEHQISKAHLLGHSMGGKTAMLFAVTHPELVEKLMVIDIAPKYYAPHHHEVLDALNEVDFSTITLRSQVESILEKHLPEPGVRQFLLKNIYRPNKDQLAFRFNLESLTRNNIEVGAALPSFTEFNGDTLFLSGEQSDYILEEDEALIKAHFEKAIIQKISNAGHWLHAENPTEFMQKIKAFLL